MLGQSIFHHISSTYHEKRLCTLISQMLIFADHLISCHIIVNSVHYNKIIIYLTKRILSTYYEKRTTETSKILVSREFSRFFFSFSLLVLDLEPFQFHFHFSKKSEGILFFTFHFSKKVKAIHISLFFLEKKEWNQVRGIIIMCYISSTLSILQIVFPSDQSLIFV